VDEIYATKALLEILIYIIVLCLAGIAFIRIPQIVAGVRWAILNTGANRVPPPQPPATPLKRADDERREITLHAGVQIPDGAKLVEITERKIRIERL
jgi:hypothetical protein